MKVVLSAVLFFVLAAPAQAFLVTDMDGNRVDVRDQIGNGQWTLVMMWQLNCPPCEVHKPSIEAFHEKYNSNGAHVIGLVIDGHEYMPEIKKQFKKSPVDFPSLVVYGDVFPQQMMEETGKLFETAPGYIFYTPDGEIDFSVNRMVDIDELIAYLESRVGN